MKADVARMILRRTCAATGEPFDEAEAEKLAARHSVAELEAMLREAETLPSKPGNPLADAARAGAAEEDEGPTAAEMSSEALEAGEGDETVWEAKPWLRPGARVVLPALDPGESDEAPEGLPAERGEVLSIQAEDGTCLVRIDPHPVDRALHVEPTEMLVSIDDVEPDEKPAEPGLPAAHAAATLAKRAAEIKALERKLKAAQGRAKRANETVARLEAKLAAAREGTS